MVFVTDSPTGEPAPTKIPTKKPDNTPNPGIQASERPIYTSTPMPTNTPMPHTTPAPTNTPIPTNTPAPTNTPNPVAEGAVYTGNYRNLFKELGYSDAAVNDKLESAWQQLFYGNEEEKIYYPVGSDMAYIYTADTNDVRSEGMSYGMMICVQMNKKAEFDRLWKWAKTYMQYDSGEYKDYFAWQCSTSGNRIGNSPGNRRRKNILQQLFYLPLQDGETEPEYIITESRLKLF